MTSNDLQRMLAKQKFQRNMTRPNVDSVTQLKTNINGRHNAENCIEEIENHGNAGNFEQDPGSNNAANYSYCTPRARTSDKKGFILERKKLGIIDAGQVTSDSTQPLHAPIPIKDFASSQDKISLDKLSCQATCPSHLTNSDEDMKYTDFTHLKLKNSLDHIQGKSQNRFQSNRDVHCNLDSQYHSALNSYDAQYSNSKYYAVLKIKDSILQEKESIILKLKFDISTLQHLVQERDLSIRKLLQSPEPQFNNTEFLQLHKKVESLEKLLDKNEFELSEVKSEVAKERALFRSDRKKLEEEVRGKSEIAMETKKKAKFFSERLEKYKKRVESLERYLGDLPTIEETNRMKTEADILGIQRENMISEVFELKNKLEEKTRILAAREEELKRMRGKEGELLEEIVSLNERNGRLEDSKRELGSTERDELESFKSQVCRLEKEREETAKMFSAFEQKSGIRYQKQSEEVERLKKKVETAEQTTADLKKELLSKQQSGNKVQSAMVNLSSQNQKLRDEKVKLEEQVDMLRNAKNTFEEKNHICLQLQNETFSAVKELKQISQVLLQTVDGKDPNFSLLLGFGMPETSEEAANTEAQSAKTILEVRNLRRDLEQLRSALSNRYAENIGENCTTQ